MENNSLTESTVMSGLEVHSTPIPVQNRESSKSADIDDSGIQITPKSVNKNNQSDSGEMMSMMQLLLKIDSKCDKQNENLNAKFNEIKGDINYRFEEQNNKFDDKLNTINITVIQQLDKLGRNIDNNEITENRVSESNGNSLDANQVMNYKVSNNDNYKNELTSNKNVVLESVRKG